MAIPFTKNGKLITAIQMDDGDKIKQLLKDGADPYTYSSGFQYNAVQLITECWNQPKALLAYAEAAPDILKKPKLLAAISKRAVKTTNTSALEALLKRGLDVNQKVDDERTLLAIVMECYDASCNRLKLSNLLLDRGAGIQNINPLRQVHLIQDAIRGDDLVLIEKMIQKGFDINLAERGTGQTSLHFAAENKKFAAVQLLLRKRADVTLRNSEGLTAAEVPSNEAIRRLFKIPETSPPPPATEIKDKEWILLSPERVAHVQLDTPIGQKVTDVFNFTARERMITVQNTETKVEYGLMKSFDEIADKTPVERAWQELRKLGGTADESLITASPRKLKSLKDPGMGG